MPAAHFVLDVLDEHLPPEGRVELRGGHTAARVRVRRQNPVAQLDVVVPPLRMAPRARHKEVEPK